MDDRALWRTALPHSGRNRIFLPARPERSGDAYLRFIPRTEMDIAVVREAVGSDLVLLGNVAPLDTLARGTPEQVLEEARACVGEAAPGGRFILSAGGGASPGTAAENLDALVRAARET